MAAAARGADGDNVSAMGLYRDHLLPRLMDVACRGEEMEEWRRRAAGGLRGRVVEIGFGSGLNLRHYPAAVEAVLAVEPSPGAWRLAQPRIDGVRLAVHSAGTDAQSIELADGAADMALSTFTLCTVLDPMRALLELRRVLGPGGRLHFVEHGLAADPRVARCQRRLDPLQRRLAGGCHLSRDIPALIVAAGFELERLAQSYARGPRPWSWFSIGVASAH
jgi:SAM-dependent methyltransferase